MLERIDKARLIEEVRARLEQQLERVTQAQKSTQAGVVHEDNRAEGDKDMRSTEASYVARGQALRVVELHEEVRLMAQVQVKRFEEGDPVAWGALFTLEDESGTFSHHLLTPGGAGLSLKVPLRAAEGGARGAPRAPGEPETGTNSEEITLSLVSARSPLGQALLGLSAGDLVNLDAETTSREWTLVEVA